MIAASFRWALAHKIAIALAAITALQLVSIAWSIEAADRAWSARIWAEEAYQAAKQIPR